MPIEKIRGGTLLLFAVCLLYVQSAAAFVSDLVRFVLQVSNISIC